MRQTLQIQFCPCKTDNARLVEMGFIGATPVHPRTAFSIRLLRTHQVYWKYMTTPTQGFASALDELLDDFNPLIEVKGTRRVSVTYPTTFDEVVTYYTASYAVHSPETGEHHFRQLSMRIEQSSSKSGSWSLTSCSSTLLANLQSTVHGVLAHLWVLHRQTSQI